MSFLSGGDWTGGGSRGGAVLGSRVDQVQIEQRRAIRSGLVCAGTLACPRCDAPVAVGPDPRRATDPLTCPYCRHPGPVREFLSLSTPTRPTHVVVRVDVGARG